MTGFQARKKVHEIRSQVDGILVGVNTVMTDDPQLNVRGIKKGKDPARIILDSYLRTPYGAQLFSTRGGPVILVTASGHSLRVKKYQELGALVLPIKPDSQGRIPLSELLRKLAKREITSLLVEGGATVLKSFEKKKLFDEVNLFVAPKIIGFSPEREGWVPSVPLQFSSLKCHGPDFEIRSLNA